MLLVSADPVKTTSGNDYYITGQKGYIYGIDELNAICAIYGQGKGAASARSMETNDVNNILGYNPSSYSTYGKVYKYKRANSYYTYAGTKNYYVEYSANGGSSYTTTTIYDRFNYFDGQNFVNLGTGSPVDITSTQYVYSVFNVVGKQGTVQSSLTFQSANLESSPSYWLARRTESVSWNGSIVYALDFISGQCVNLWGNSSAYLYKSDNSSVTPYAFGVRPVVVLDSNVEIDTSNTSKDGSSVSSAWEIK